MPRAPFRAVAAVLVGILLLGGAARSASAAELSNPDPWEPMNRGIFWFNEKADIYVLAPVAKGWRFVTPSILRTALSNFSNTLQQPVVLANNILQLKPGHARDDITRLVFNVTFGIGGLIDFARYIDVPQNDEDFGQSLGYWGAPAGPYLVLPFLGPSNIRDGIGRAGDATGTLYFSLLPFWSTILVQGVDIINLRSYYIEEIAENRQEAFDYYVFMRNAYIQNRRGRIGRALGEDPSAALEEDLYFFEDDDEEFLDEAGDGEPEE